MNTKTPTSVSNTPLSPGSRTTSGDKLPALQPTISLGSSTESYLSELLSYSLERLKKEPEILKQESEQIHRQMLETAATQYEAFLAADHCLTSLESNFEQLNRSLDGCVEMLPSFVSSCDAFLEGSEVARSKGEDTKKLSMHREHVAKLLEIPKLMETCVRNGHVDEALDLQLFLQRLDALHGDLSAVQSLTASLSKVQELILAYLTEKLKSGIQLPECLAVVGHLRRLAVYSDRDLHLCFLHCREQWISHLVEELQVGTPFEYVKRLVDIHRLHLFDIVMQYKAVFPSELEDDEGSLLSEWSLNRVTQFVEALRAKLAEVTDGASLLSLLESCMYCGMSLGRVGLDFRSLLTPIFESRILELFKTKLLEAVDAFSTLLEVHRWSEAPVRSPTTAESNGASEEGVPPTELTKHLPLALFLNGYLSALNELRHCAPIRGEQSIRTWTQQALEEVASTLRRYAAGRTFDPAQRSVFISACRQFSTVMCSYVAVSLSRIFPHASPTMDTSLVVQHLQQIDGYHETTDDV